MQLKHYAAALFMSATIVLGADVESGEDASATASFSSASESEEREESASSRSIHLLAKAWQLMAASSLSNSVIFFPLRFLVYIDSNRWRGATIPFIFINTRRQLSHNFLCKGWGW
jgi:hypothetical protein